MVNLFPGHARKKLRSFVPVPQEQSKADDEKKMDECDKCNVNECVDCVTEGIKQEEGKDDAKRVGKKIRKPRKNRKANGKEGQCFFPSSFPMLYGPLAASEPSTSAGVLPPIFPYNVSFKQVKLFKF